jgi:hypothetical protein
MKNPSEENRLIFVNYAEDVTDIEDHKYAFVDLKNERVYFAESPQLILQLLCLKSGIRMLEIEPDDVFVYLEMDWYKDLRRKLEIDPTFEEFDYCKARAIEFAKIKAGL